jgi:EmrB/QacA subfamily drug resistance transporter
MSSTQVQTRCETAQIEPSAVPPQTRRRWWVLGVVGLAQLMVVLDVTIMTIALPSAQRALHFNNDGRQWVVTAYSLAFGSLLLLGGRLADLLGRKRMFLLGIVGFASASALGGAATSFAMLVTARAIQGLFGALMAPTALSLLTTTFTDPKERARAFGVFGAIAGSGAAVGLMLGGLLTEYLDWRWTLFVNVIIAVVALAGAILFVPRAAPAGRRQLDVPGVVLAAVGLFCLVFGSANAETHPWSDWMTWGFLAVGSVVLGAFLFWQRQARDPLLPLTVPADRNRGASLVTVFIASAGLFGVFLFLTYYLQTTLGYSAVRCGLAFLPMVGALIVTAQLATNVLASKIEPKVVVPLGLLLAAIGTAGLTRLGLHSSYPADLLPPLLAIGAGTGLAMPTALSQATLGVPMTDQGVARPPRRPPSRSAGRSAPRCSTLWPPSPPRATSRRTCTTPWCRPRRRCTATPPRTGGRRAFTPPAPSSWRCSSTAAAQTGLRRPLTRPRSGGLGARSLSDLGPLGDGGLGLNRNSMISSATRFAESRTHLTDRCDVATRR